MNVPVLFSIAAAAASLATSTFAVELPNTWLDQQISLAKAATERSAEAQRTASAPPRADSAGPATPTRVSEIGGRPVQPR